jgi:hypothetical protein
MAVSMVSDPGAAGKPSDAEERFHLYQDVILFRMQQSLTADSLI